MLQGAGGGAGGGASGGAQPRKRNTRVLMEDEEEDKRGGALERQGEDIVGDGVTDGRSRRASEAFCVSLKAFLDQQVCDQPPRGEG